MFYDGKWVLQQVDNNHDCEPSRARVIAEKLRHERKEIVRADPNEYTRKHRENDPRCSNNKFTCPVCEKKFAMENELKIHMNNQT